MIANLDASNSRAHLLDYTRPFVSQYHRRLIDINPFAFDDMPIRVADAACHQPHTHLVVGDGGQVEPLNDKRAIRFVKDCRFHQRLPYS